ncbi:hypothetical protein PHYBOEH_005164 [Phytophthora boehmeriae]|uniref:Uncharacterized protein n=1 Tax=Phytophthora boehmeriae TaxID=109152 RepID=A0A8T1WPM0_9STRA|nr:hypothetical protein PHYBOEH_005164 [Phytophthora boehmeriae]
MDASGSSLVGDVHANGGDIDSLLSNDPDVGDKTRRLLEPYERHRAHDLRAECYRRGIRPIKKGPNANDNKNGYIVLLRKYDGSPNSSQNGHEQLDKRVDAEDDDVTASDHTASSINTLTAKRKLPTSSQPPAQAADAATPTATELQSFYDGAQPNLVPGLSMQYPAAPALGKTTAANPATDLEILSGIANSYTQNVAADGQLCGNCRTVVTDQLMDSIRLGKTKMQLQEMHKLTDQRDRDTNHLKEVLGVMADLRKAFREAQASGMNHELLIELQDDMAFFRTLKEQTKERMRQAMQEARERAAKSNATA